MPVGLTAGFDSCACVHAGQRRPCQDGVKQGAGGGEGGGEAEWRRRRIGVKEALLDVSNIFSANIQKRLSQHQSTRRWWWRRRCRILLAHFVRANEDGGRRSFFFRMKPRQTRRARTRERGLREFVTKKIEMEHAHIRVGTPAETERWECWEEVREV